MQKHKLNRYYNKYNKPIPKKKTVINNKYIYLTYIILLLILFILIHKILKPNIKTSQTNTIKAEAIQKLAHKEVVDWSQKTNQLQANFNKTCQLLVLEGIVNINTTFTDKDYSDTRDKLNFLQKKLADWKSRSLNISAKYTFGYTYDLSELTINNLNDGNLQIILYQHNLNVKYLAEQTKDTVLSSTYGFLSDKFSVQETASIMDRAKAYTYNSVVSNKEIRDKATKYTIDNIKDISNKFGFYNIEVKVIGDGLIENHDVVLSGITYK